MIYLEQIVNALVIGSVYALMALGLSRIFGVLRLVNFAHAQAIMAGGFVYFYLTTLAHLQSSWWLFVALLASAPFLFAFGVILERGFLRPAHRQPPAILKGQISLGQLIIAGDRLTAAGLSIVIIAALLLFLYRTFPGKGLRAVAQSPEAAAISGINVAHTRTMAFGLGITLTGLAGGLLGPVFLVSPTMGEPFAIKAFVIVVLGGMGSIGGSIVGAFLLALVESIGTVIIPDMSRALAYKDAYGLLLLIIILLVRPQGLFGIKERRA